MQEKQLYQKKSNSQKEHLKYQSHILQEKQGQTSDGVDYHFVTEEEFKILLKKNAFYEHSVIFGNYYGTSKASVDDIINKKFNVLFDIDWKGAKQLSAFKELNLLKIFILPPSKEELEKRLIARNQDGKESIKKRVLAYSQDIKHANEYDHVITNDNVENCYNKILRIIQKHLKN